MNEVYKARFKRRTLHVPNLMQMRKIYCFRSFALDSAHEKFDVWTGPNMSQKNYLRVGILKLLGIITNHLKDKSSI